VAKLNISAAPATASRLNILGVPFMFVYDRGKLQESLPGIGDQHELMRIMARYL
jgi:thiol:disulfide interchange protein